MRIYIVIFIAIFLSCEKEENFPQGDIVGFVNLIDESGNDIPDKSGVSVLLEGVSGETKTNEIGRFVIKNANAGTYNLIIKKAGFGQYKKSSFQFIGGNVPAFLNVITLYELPEIEIQSLEVTSTDGYIIIDGMIEETKNYAFMVFINDSSNVSNLNFDYSTGKYSYCCLPTNWIHYDIYTRDLPYALGSDVYLVLYFMNYREQAGYYDYSKNTYIYTSVVKTSDIIKVKVK